MTPEYLNFVELQDLTPALLSACAQGDQVEHVDLLTIAVTSMFAGRTRHNRLSHVAPRQWRRFCILLTPIKRMTSGGTRPAGYGVGLKSDHLLIGIVSPE